MRGGGQPAFCLITGLISLYYRDPEGNRRAASDNFSDWKLSARLCFPDFAANPIGTFFDPAKVYDELGRGPILRLFEVHSGWGALNLIPVSGCPA